MNIKLKSIIAVLWYEAVRERCGVETAYAFEKLFWPNSFRRSGGETQRPCKADRYKRGLRRPDRKSALDVERRYPGTLKWLELPLWLVMDDRRWTQRELERIITNERPDLIRRLRPNGNSESPYLLTLDSLWREGNVRALTVLLALLRYAKLRGLEHVHANAAFVAKQVFFCIATRPPFYSVRREMFEYLNPRFFSDTYSFETKMPGASVQHALTVISKLRKVLTMADELGLISYQPRSRTAFAYNSLRSGIDGIYSKLLKGFTPKWRNRADEIWLWRTSRYERWEGVSGSIGCSNRRASS